MTNYEVKNALRRRGPEHIGPAINWSDFDTLMSGLPMHKQVFIYDQMVVPNNWDEEKFGRFIPQRLINLRVPSRHKNNVHHVVVIAYVPETFPMAEEDIPNPFGFRLPGFRRIVGYACVGKDCHIGFRTLGCCSHVAAAMIYLGEYSRHPEQFKTLYRPVHRLDIRHPKSLNRELFGVNYPNVLNEDDQNPQAHQEPQAQNEGNPQPQMAENPPPQNLFDAIADEMSDED